MGLWFYRNKGYGVGKETVKTDGYGKILGSPSMPPDRMEYFDRNEYKDHRKWMHRSQTVGKAICNAKLTITSS